MTAVPGILVAWSRLRQGFDEACALDSPKLQRRRQAGRRRPPLIRQLMLGAPLRARAAHVVQLGTVGFGDNSKEAAVARDDRAEALSERHGGPQCSLPSAAAKGMTKSSTPSSSVTRSSQPR